MRQVQRDNMSQQAIDYYNSSIAKTAGELKVNNLLGAPKVRKVVINCGFGSDKGNKDVKDELMESIAAITGQKPVVTIAKKSIASFKLRSGEQIGIKVTLRGKKMINFLHKLINLTLPSIRDFRGIPSKSIDKSGNLTIGIKEQYVFPELNLNRGNISRGLEICIASKVKDIEEANVLYKSLGVPFRKEQ